MPRCFRAARNLQSGNEREAKMDAKDESSAHCCSGSHFCCVPNLGGGGAGVLPITAVEVMRNGQPMRPIPGISTLSSAHAGWHGVAMESFTNVPPVSMPEHDHPTHFINLLTSGTVRTEWTTGGRTRRAVTTPGNLYLLPVGTRDRLKWKDPSNRIALIIQPEMVTNAFAETSPGRNGELAMHWTLHDRHVASLILAMHADLEDGSPAGPLYGESLASALCVYLARKYGVFRPKLQSYHGGIPKVRLDRVVEYIRANLSQEIRLHELAQVAGMSTHYFCELFKQSTGLSPHRYVLKQRIDEAKASLIDPKVNVATAGAMAGFINQSHFTKVFKKLVGVTPTEFRARI